MDAKKSLLLDRLSEARESWPAVLFNEGLFAFDVSLFTQLFEPCMYYGKLGLLANHDMNMLRMFHALRYFLLFLHAINLG